MAKRNNIKVSFICNQNWNAMKSTANGRYCDICRNEVFDFTNKTISEVNKLGKNVCGLFLPEQVEEGLTPIKLNFISKTRCFVASIVMLIGLESQTLKGQNQTRQKAPTEIAIDTISNDSQQTDSLAYTHDKCVSNNDPTTQKSFMRIGQRYFYWSKRFPFIVSRRHVMGAFW
jgi:hypothetical protein